jgi:hypothetical protein
MVWSEVNGEVTQLKNTLSLSDIDRLINQAINSH